MWNTYSFFITYAKLDNFNPLDSNHNVENLMDIDKWILAKINEFINTSKKYYESFQLYKLTKNASEILDDISYKFIQLF